LVDENDYPAWSAEAAGQLWRMKFTPVATSGETKAPTANIETKHTEPYTTLLAEEPQLKIRAATNAAEAWNVLRETYEEYTRPMSINHRDFSGVIIL